MPRNQKLKPKIVIAHDHSSSEDDLRRGSSEAERPVLKFERSGPLDQLESSTSTATSTNESIVSSIEQFQTDFTEMKCKMKIFGESLNLCKCIAFDFKSKIKTMDKRLRDLEKRVRNERTQSNYSAIIKKNKQLSNKSIMESKKLQMCTTEEEMKRVAGKICRNYLPGVWKTIDSADLEFRKITGGLSNFLYYVALPTDASKIRYEQQSDSNISLDGEGGGGFAFDEPKKVLLRIYGQVHGERAMDAIVTESVIFTLLSERRLGPKLYGVFSGGRIEEFIPTRCLLTKELRDPALSMKIAEKMAAIHSMDVPLNKEPNYIWKTMNKWLNTVKEDRLAGNKAKNEAEQHIIRNLKLTDFQQEVEFLKRLVNSVDSPVCFCHNDLQEGNILYMEEVEPEPPVDEDYVSSYVQTFDDTENAPEEIQEKVTLVEKNTRAQYMETIDDGNTTDSHISDSGEPKLYLIDFEYCAYNYRGFDIANHFQEWMYDYTNEEAPFYLFNPENLPTLEQKEIFIKEYLKNYNANQSEGQSTQDVAVTVTQINKLLYEVEAFAMVSHLFWGLWAIVNAGKSKITFGYWEYALNRIEMYLRLKQEFLKDESTNRASKRKICEVDI